MSSNITVTFVSAFINVYNLSDKDFHDKYINNFKKLENTGIPIVLFMDKKYKDYKFNDNVKIVKYIDIDELEFCKLIRDKTIVLPTYRNMVKDNENYMKIINNKIFFVNEAIKLNLFNTHHYAWIDFGIFHVFKNDEWVSQKLIEISKKNFPENYVCFPGAWPKMYDMIHNVNWRFLGGFFIIDKNNLEKLVHIFLKVIRDNDLPLLWEVNYWALIEANNLFDFGWHLADHNESIINI
jgi:hypothetical protein